MADEEEDEAAAVTSGTDGVEAAAWVVSGPEAVGLEPPSPSTEMGVVSNAPCVPEEGASAPGVFEDVSRAPDVGTVTIDDEFDEETVDVATDKTSGAIDGGVDVGTIDSEVDPAIDGWDDVGPGAIVKGIVASEDGKAVESVTTDDETALLPVALARLANGVAGDSGREMVVAALALVVANVAGVVMDNDVTGGEETAEELYIEVKAVEVMVVEVMGEVMEVEVAVVAVEAVGGPVVMTSAEYGPGPKEVTARTLTPYKASGGGVKETDRLVVSRGNIKILTVNVVLAWRLCV